MGLFSSDEREEIFSGIHNSTVEKALRLRIEDLERNGKELESDLDKLRKDKERLLEELERNKILISTLHGMIGIENNKLENKVSTEDYLTRQKRIFNNKVNHGFNITNIYQEARYILEETAELMRAIEKNDRENMIEELADIVIFAYGCAEVARLGDLDTKIFEKMSINEKRVYEKNGEGDFVKTTEQ